MKKQSSIATLVSGLIATLIMVGTATTSQASPYSDRNLTASKGILRLDLAPADFGLRYSGAIGAARGLDIRRYYGDTASAMRLGLAYGITDAFEIGGLIMPIQLSPDTDWGDMEIYGRGRLLDTGSAQIGLQAVLFVPGTPGRDLGIATGIPMLFKIGQRARVDTGFEAEFFFADGDNVINLDVPLAFTVNFTRQFFAGVRTGIFVRDSEFEELAIPLGAQAGYTVYQDKVDLVGSFGFPLFATPGSDGDKITNEIFNITVGATFRIDLGQFLSRRPTNRGYAEPPRQQPTY